MNQKILDKQLKRYFKNLKKKLNLTYSSQEIDSIIRIMQQNAYSYFEEHPAATFEDFENYFGNVENLSPDIFELEFSQNPSSNMNSLFFQKKWSEILGISFLAVLFFIGGLYLKHYYDAQNTIVTHEEIIIEEISTENTSTENYDN